VGCGKMDEYDIQRRDNKYFVKENAAKYNIPLDKRIFNFVIRIIKYLKNIKRTNINNIIIYQLTKASTSTGANLPCGIKR
jgi:hypothetical protein